MQQKKNTKILSKLNVNAMVENIIKCKWSLTVLDLIHNGINRPGAMVREIEGLTTKVLNERLNKLQRYGILDRLVFPEKPPRVEYRFTEFGGKFIKIIEAINELQSDIEASLSESDMMVAPPKSEMHP